MLKLVNGFAVLFAFVLAGTGPLFAATIDVTGSLPRDLSTGSFQFTATISGILPDQNTAGNKDPADALEQFKARFKIYLNDESTAVPFDSGGSSTINFYAKEYQSHTQEPEDNGFKYVYYIEIIETTTGELAKKAANGKINVKLEFLLGGDSVKVMDTSKTLEQDSFVINKAPDYDETSPVIGSHKSLTVKWKTEDSVDALAGATAVKKKPTKMLVFLIDSEQITEATLEAMKYSGTTAADTAATCRLTLTADNLQTCVTCEENVYLLEKGQTGILFKTAAADSGSVSFTNLENDRKYYALMQFEPDGVKRSQCLAGIPSTNHTLTELNGAGEATIVDFRCFIATAAYGSPTHANLRFFRKFRDAVLLKSAPGKLFVHLYYTYSPPAADYIAERPWLRSIVQKLLVVPLSLLEASDGYY